MTTPDSKALKILFDTYWSPAGWKGDRITPAEDLEYAKSAGLMFEPSSFTHDELITRARRVAREVEARDVADAFLSSLGSRRLDLRSALGSHAILNHLPDHGEGESKRACSVCGTYLKPSDEDWNVLNFERHKWGGVRHDKVPYACFDLEQFRASPPPRPSGDDIAIFRAILQAVDSAPPGTTSAKLQNYLAPVLKSNKSEREILIAILGFAGILETKEHPGYLRSFIRADERDIPSRHFVDMPYPACWWRRTDGVNHEAVAHWFGHRLDEG